MISAAPLLHVLGQLGIDISQVAASETPATLNHQFNVTGAAARNVADDVFLAVPAAYGAAVTIEFLTAGLTELRIDPAVTVQNLADFRSRTQATARLDVRLRVDKAQLMKELLTSPTPDGALFIFAEALERHLQAGLEGLATGVFAGRDERLVIVVLDAAFDLRGPWLTIVGAASLDGKLDVDALGFIPAAALDRVARLRDRLIGWSEPFGQHLTPWHVAADGEATPRLRALLDARQLDLTLLYSCDRARRLAGGAFAEVVAEFRGRDHVTQVTFDERADVAMSAEERGSLLELVEWLYQLDTLAEQRPDWTVDRLPFLQTRVAQVLEGSPPDTKQSTFVHTVSAILEGVQWSWKAFVEDKVSGYLDDVQALEEAVTETTEKVSASVGDLTKALSDTMLAAVAVLVGTFIGAAFDSPFNERLFRVGMFAYAAYVFFFPGVAGLVSAWQQRDRTVDAFEYRRQSFVAALGADRVSAIVGNRISSAKTTFAKAVRVVATLYVLVVLAAVSAALLIPGFIADDETPAGGEPATSTSTSTSTSP